MDDHIRISDAERDRVTARLRDHFAEGRLTIEELDERITATLNAKTTGDLRGVMADLPGTASAAPLPPQAKLSPRVPWAPPRGGPPWISGRRRFRILPLAALALLAALLIQGGGWLFFALATVVLMFWLVAGLAGVFMAAGFRRRMRRDWRAGHSHYQRAAWPGGCGHRGRRYSNW